MGILTVLIDDGALVEQCVLWTDYKNLEYLRFAKEPWSGQVAI